MHKSSNTYSPIRITQLLRIKKGKSQKKKLEKLSVKWNIPYPLIYATWNRELKKANNTKLPAVRKGSIKSVQAGVGKAITPYVLEEGADIPSRGDHASTHALINSLLPLVTVMEPHKHSIPIYKSNRTTVRKWLTKEIEPKNGFVYTISPVKDNKDIVRIFRRK